MQPRTYVPKQFALPGNKSPARCQAEPGERKIAMEEIRRSDSVCNHSIVYSLHRGRSRRALVRVVSACCGLYRVEWPDLGLSDLANLTRCRAAAREWAERNAILEDRKNNAAHV